MMTSHSNALDEEKRAETGADWDDEQIYSLSSYNEVVDHFRTLVDAGSFHEVAEALLTEVEDPTTLATCAELATLREPGGTYYRSKLWSKTNQLLNSSRNSDGKPSKLRSLCNAVGAQPSTIKNCILQGEAIISAESKMPDSISLRLADPDVFRYAQRQKDHAAEYLIGAMNIFGENPSATPSQIHRKWCQENGGVKANLDIIKPSDWWAFSHPKWRQEEDFPGSIPGEVYANALYYFAPREGIAIDPMAGSGMLRRVYNERERWQKDSQFNLEVYLFDLHPRRNFIKGHDARKPLPIKADWIFIDPPYYGQSSHLFDDDLAAATDYNDYLRTMTDIISSLGASLNPRGRLCVFLPKWSGLRSENPNYDVPSDVQSLAVKSGLRWIDAAFVSRGRQQEQASAFKNNSAKRKRRMRSDTCILNVFEKPGRSDV